MSRRHLVAALVAATVVLTTPAAAQASFPLMGWWPMNEGSGQTVRDWSFRGNNGVRGATSAVESSDPAWVKGVFFGSALRFDGVDDFVTVPDSASLEPKHLTLAAWVKGDAPRADYRYIVAKGATGCDRSSYGLYSASTGGVAFYVADAARAYVSPETAPTVWDGQWHHVAGTFDGSTVRLFVDGEQVGTGSPAATQIDYSYPIQGGMIGAFPGTCGNSSLTLAGDIDGVQLWSEALPVDSIWRTLKSLFSAAR